MRSGDCDGRPSKNADYSQNRNSTPSIAYVQNWNTDSNDDENGGKITQSTLQGPYSGKITQSTLHGSYRGKITQSTLHGSYRGKITQSTSHGSYRGKTSKDKDRAGNLLQSKLQNLNPGTERAVERYGGELSARDQNLSIREIERGK